MPHESITIGASATTINIVANPGFAINTPAPQVTAIEANPTATSVNINEVSASISVSTQTFDFGGIASAPVTLNVGTQQDPVSVNQDFSNFKYKFPNFAQDVSTFSAGDVVYFESSSETSYGVRIEKADVTNTSRGAKGALYIFIEKSSSNTLILLHKGFHDYANSSTQIDTWIAGHTLYLNSSSKLDADVGQFAAGQWIRSLGFCVPNTTSTKRIWFEGDTTFVKLKVNT
tara:strand:- start:481 stop:1173 length:693 start_codon:yes stop_codon:yes gene_type:complete